MSSPVANTDLRFGEPPNVAPVYQLSSPVATDLRFNNPNVVPVYVENASIGVFNVLAYGAKGDGVTDDTAAWNAAIAAGIAAGGYCMIYGPDTPGGTGYALSAPLTPFSAPGMVLIGGGRYGTYLHLLDSFNPGGNPIITITAKNCEVRNLRIGFSGGTSSSKPAATCIQSAGARYTTIDNVDFFLINGYLIEIMGNATDGPYGSMISHIHCLSCAGGIHYKGVSTSNWAVQAWASDINLEGVDGPLDAWLIEDAFDVLISNVNGAVTQGTNSQSFFHIKGNCATISIINPDVGALGTMTAPEVLIESGTNGTPKGVKIANGVIQRGTINLLINAGTEIVCVGMNFSQSANSAVDIEGSSGYIVLADCILNNTNQSGGTGYDLVDNSTGRVLMHNCFFRTVVGSGAGKVTNSCSISASNKLYLLNNYFDGLGGVPANAFAGGQPALVTRGNANYNPLGAFTVGVPANGVAKSFNYDTTVIINVLNTLTAVAIGGTTVPGTPAAGSQYHVVAGQTITLTYSGTAPTWVTLAD